MIPRGCNPSIGLALALALNSCMTGDDYMFPCTTEPSPPTLLALDPDSLVVSASSRSKHIFKPGGNSVHYYRDVDMSVSRGNGSPAFAHFDNSGLSLYADDIRIATPPPSLSVSGGQCPSYYFMSSVHFPGAEPETSFTLQVRKGDATARSWKVEYKFDDTKLPEFSVSTYATGLTSVMVFKPGAEINGITFGRGTWSNDLPYKRSGDTVRSDIAFQRVDALHAQLDSASLYSTEFRVCAKTGAGYESTLIDGVALPDTTDFCWVLEGESRANVVEYEKHFCWNCK
jgi:hypothetical protein